MARLDSVDMAQLRDFIAVSNGYREEKFSKARRPKTMRRWFNGDHYGPGMPLTWVTRKDRVVVGLSQANVIAKVSLLAYGPPAVTVTGLNEASRRLREREKRYLQEVWRVINAQAAVRKALMDCKTVGTGVLGTGWSFAGTDAEGRRVSDVALIDRVVRDQSVVRSLRAENLLLDPDTPDSLQAGWWCGERIVRSLRQVRRMPQYAHIAERLSGMAEMPGAYRSAAGQRGEDDHLRGVEIFKMHFNEERLIVEYCAEVQDEPMHVWDTELYPLDDQDRPYYPYVVLRNVPDYNGENGESTHYGIGDVEITESQQMEIDADRATLAKHRRMTVPNYFVRKGVLTDADRGRLAEGAYNAVYELEVPQGADVGREVVPGLRANVAPETYTSEDRARRDFSELTRISGYDRGTDVPGVKTATQGAFVQAGAQAGKGMERQEFEEAVAEVVAQISYLEHRHGEMERYIELPEEEADEVGGSFGDLPPDLPPEARQAKVRVAVTGQSLRGRYEHSIEPESMAPPNAEMDEQKWYARVQAFLPFIPMGLDPKPVLRAYLTSFDCPEADKVLAGMDQLLEMRQQAEGAAGEVEQVKQELGRVLEWMQERGIPLEEIMAGAGVGAGLGGMGDGSDDGGYSGGLAG